MSTKVDGTSRQKHMSAYYIIELDKNLDIKLDGSNRYSLNYKDQNERFGKIQGQKMTFLQRMRVT